MTNAYHIEFSRLNTLENQETTYHNHTPFNINLQNHIATTPGHTEVPNNIATTSSYAKPNWGDIKRKLKELLKFEYCNAIRKNSLLLLLYNLLYLDFDDACHKNYSNQIEQSLLVLIILIQDTRKSNYVGELIHLIACLNKIWGPKIK